MQANGIPRPGGLRSECLSGCCKGMVAILVLVPMPSSGKRQLITNNQDLFLCCTFCLFLEVKLEACKEYFGLLKIQELHIPSVLLPFLVRLKLGV